MRISHVCACAQTDSIYLQSALIWFALPSSSARPSHIYYSRLGLARFCFFIHFLRFAVVCGVLLLHDKSILAAGSSTIAKTNITFLLYFLFFNLLSCSPSSPSSPSSDRCDVDCVRTRSSFTSFAALMIEIVPRFFLLLILLSFVVVRCVRLCSLFRLTADRLLFFFLLVSRLLRRDNLFVTFVCFGKSADVSSKSFFVCARVSIEFRCLLSRAKAENVRGYYLIEFHYHSRALYV